MAYLFNQEFGLVNQVLGWFGVEIYRKAPPIPDRVVVASEGRTLFTGQDIRDGQNVWQSLGGQEVVLVELLRRDRRVARGGERGGVRVDRTVRQRAESIGH